MAEDVSNLGPVGSHINVCFLLELQKKNAWSFLFYPAFTFMTPLKDRHAILASEPFSIPFCHMAHWNDQMNFLIVHFFS